MANRFSQKVVLVSGSGAGVGREIAAAFAKEGAYLALFDKDEKGVKALIRKLGTEDRVIATRMDIANIEEVDSFLERVRSRWRKVDVLVNNVGIGLVKAFAATSQDDFDSVLKTNFKGPFFLTQKAVEIMEPGSSILFITSIHAEHPSLDPTYDSSKAAVNSLVSNLALDLAKKGIRVNAVAPGHIDTKVRGVPRRQIDVPLGKRAGTPKDVADACLFLADSAFAAYITGAILPVSGGLHIPKAMDLKL